MEPITKILKNVIQEIKDRQQSHSRRVCRIYKNILTKRERAHIKGDSLHKGILTIFTDSSAWAYQLNFKKERLLSQLHGKIKDIHFCIK
jgi:hypothetical protein